MNHNLEIQKILLQVEKQSNPDDKMRLLKQAINIADANNDLDWGFDLRLDLIYHEKDTSHCVDSFPAFAWLLNAYDNNSELFNEADFLWEYKWMASSSRRNVNISREQVENIMADLKERMSRNGYTDRAYLNVQFYWLLFLGETEAARECMKERDAVPRDRMSHCEACEQDSRVEMELIDGNFDNAIAQAHDLFNEKMTCGRLPFATYCNFAYYMGRAGDDRATEYFNLADEELSDKKDDYSFVSEVSMLMLYLAKYNKEKGFEYFQRYADWAEGAEDAVQFDFALAALALLKRDEGVRTLELSAKLPYYNSSNQYDMADLYNHYHKIAEALSAQFDARNGNSYFATRLAEVVA